MGCTRRIFEFVYGARDKFTWFMLILQGARKIVRRAERYRWRILLNLLVLRTRGCLSVCLKPAHRLQLLRALALARFPIVKRSCYAKLIIGTAS